MLCRVSRENLVLQITSFETNTGQLLKPPYLYILRNKASWHEMLIFTESKISIIVCKCSRKLQSWFLDLRFTLNLRPNYVTNLM